MNILYLDLFAGISGDMTLGAFIDLGVKEEVLLDGFKKLNIDGYHIKIDKKEKNAIMGTKVDIILEEDHQHNHEYSHGGEHDHGKGHSHEHHHEHHHEHTHEHDHDHNHNQHSSHTHTHDRNLFTIEKLIDESELEEKIKELSKKIFKYVALAESKIHGKPLDEIHFHEVGAVDSILDIVGTAICLNELEIDKIISSPLHVGSGFVYCQHGLIPVPVPATLEILKEENIPFYSSGIKSELVTPTGAAIVAGIVDEFSDMPNMEAKSVGYGAGTHDLQIPNMVRMVLGVKKK
ncbi:MAG: LarC family nickel insertion protein [Tissierella sp.]|uniref:LarC family nickel insertion protein n=1 Tax=Tissierella sp. TaxID=41274 RepID=UPI003F972BE3